MNVDIAKNSFIWKAIHWLNKSYEKSGIHYFSKAVGNFFKTYGVSSAITSLLTKEFVMNPYVEGSRLIKLMETLSAAMQKRLDAWITIVCLAMRNSFVFSQWTKWNSACSTYWKRFEAILQHSQIGALLMKWLESEKNESNADD